MTEGNEQDGVGEKEEGEKVEEEKEERKKEGREEEEDGKLRESKEEEKMLKDNENQEEKVGNDVKDNDKAAVQSDDDQKEKAVIIASEGKQAFESKALDGGWGWFIVLGCALMHLLIGGLNRSYGVMYMELRQRFGSSAAVTAWIGGAGVAIRMGLSPVATALCSRFSVRSVMLVGGVILWVAMIICAFTPNTEFMFFSYSFLTGIGGTMVYTPPIVLVGQYFHRLRGIAVALGSCGSGLGMFIFPPLIAFLFETFSYSGACLILAAVMLNCCVSGALMRPLDQNHKKRHKTPSSKSKDGSLKDGKKEFDSQKLKKQYLDTSLMKNPVFLAFALSQGFITMSYFAAQMLLSDFAKVKGSSLQESVRLLSYLGVSDAIGRLSGGFIFDMPLVRPHRRLVYNVYIFISAATCFLWAASVSYVMIVVVSVIHGLFNGQVVSQRSVIAADLLGAERLPSTFGLTVAVQGIGLMVGPFFAGLIKDRMGSYVGSYLFCGVSTLLSGFIFMMGTVGKTCRRRELKDRTIGLSA